MNSLKTIKRIEFIVEKLPKKQYSDHDGFTGMFYQILKGDIKSRSFSVISSKKWKRGEHFPVSLYEAWINLIPKLGNNKGQKREKRKRSNDPVLLKNIATEIFNKIIHKLNLTIHKKRSIPWPKNLPTNRQLTLYIMMRDPVLWTKKARLFTLTSPIQYFTASPSYCSYVNKRK